MDNQFSKSRQQVEMPMVTPANTRKAAQVSWWYAQACYVQIKCDDQSWQGSGHNSIESLTAARQQFEPEAIGCYATVPA
ncbi:MAG: hypothetical protein AAF892_02205 [Cyanobacteria bacterium P01_D01_bin.71]